MDKQNRLNSSDDTINIELNFKLIAGPGAGKTRFLINHISNVRSNSRRLGKNKKIGCITYTKSGVNTINQRLEDSNNYVETSTIHSFLYKHIVKPYLWIFNDLDFPIDKLNGHEEPKHGYSFLKEFKTRTNQGYFKDDKKLGFALSNLKWIFDEEKNLKLGFQETYKRKIGKYFLKEESYLTYKKLCWKYGILSHEDVLYFGYKLLFEYQLIRKVIRSKFPYIFVDEFQDTNPLQTEILKLIGEEETIIGVIGDPAQSIYSFQGANLKSFKEFTIKDMIIYTIKENKRSAIEIINLANFVRSDEEFEQNNPNGLSGGKLNLYVGETKKAYSLYEKSDIRDESDWCVISFKNEYSKGVKLNGNYNEEINLDLFYEDNERGKLIYFVINAIEYGSQMQLKEALKLLKKAYRKVEGYSDREALSDLKLLLNNYSEIYDLSLKEFYNQYIYGRYNIKNKVQRGKYNEIYDGIIFKEFLKTISINDDVSQFKTIHKVKGEEYNDIFLILPEEKNLDFIINPDLNIEENRVYYVAITRTKKNLFINIPMLGVEKEEKLHKLGFTIKRV